MADRSRHRAQRPVRGVRGRRLQRSSDRFGNRLIADLTRRARTGLVEEALHTTLREAPPPLADGVGGRANAQADVLVLHAFRRRQDDARPLSQPLRRLSPRRQTLKLTPLALPQIDRNRRLAHRQSSAAIAENCTSLPIRTLDAQAFMKSLCRGAQFAIESLRGPGLEPPARRRIMLDVVFVVLGLAVLALMGAYAVGLRQL